MHFENVIFLILSKNAYTKFSEGPTCALDQFIDAATAVLATGEKKYAQMLREMYADIRAPFAQACACLVFGMQGMEEEIPFLLHEYERFQQAYPKESYDQHPLLGLYLLHGKY